MRGPLQMTRVNVEANVPRTPGAYLLGNDQNRALFVGRSDVDLRGQLLAHFGPVGANRIVVTRFWYEVAGGPWEAYAAECRWYHQFAPTHNANHPSRPLGALFGCPICGR